MPEATSDALAGLGMPAQLAALIGGNPSALTCVGTTQVGAAIIKSKNTELVTAASNTAAIFPSNAAVMEPYWITVQSATAAVLWVPVGHTLNGTLNSSVLSGTGMIQFRSIIIWQYKVKNWTYILGSVL
jgi:hypothetical protein